MAKVAATELEVAGRTVRVSNPDKIYFPERGFTKLDVVRVLPRRRRRHPARAAGAADHAAALAAACPGRSCHSRPGDAFFQKRLPTKGVPAVDRDRGDQVPERAHRRRAVPGRPRPRGLGGADGHDRVPPVAGAAPPMWTRPDELRIDLDPQPGTDFADAVAGRRRGPRGARRAGLGRLPEDLRRPRRARLRADPPQWTFTEVRRAAIAFGPGDRAAPAGPGHHRVVEGGARASGSSSTTTRWPATARSPAPTRCAPTPGPPSRPRSPGTSCPRSSPNDFDLRHGAGAVRRDRRPARRRSTTSPTTSRRCWSGRSATSAPAQGDMPYPPDYPKMPGEPHAGAAAAARTRNWRLAPEPRLTAAGQVSVRARALAAPSGRSGSC